MRDKQKSQAQSLRYYYAHKEERLAYYRENREREILRKRRNRGGNVNAPIIPFGQERPKLPKLDYKTLVFAHYGVSCVCCDEQNAKLLTLDHINNNGKEHGTGKNRYKGLTLYRFLHESSYPKGIQTLCFNCNIGRKNNGGICPHKS